MLHETVASFAIKLASQGKAKLGTMLPACGYIDVFKWKLNMIQHDSAPV